MRYNTAENKDTRFNVAARLGRRRKSTFALRMAPMIDVIFLLLIFFLITADFRPSEEFLPMRIDTAGAQTTAIGQVQPLVITIEQVPNGCRVTLDHTETVMISDENFQQNLSLLTQTLRDVMTQQKRFPSDPIELVCSDKLKWDYLAKIYNVFFGIGATDITFNLTE